MKKKMETINKSVGKGIAGRRASYKPKGAVIHNDSGYMSAKQYVSWLGNHDLTKGFAHYYGDRNTMFRAEDTYNMAWHTGNSDGNSNYVGYEVCQSLGASDKEFLENEQAIFKQVAEDFKYWGLTPNRSTIRLHKEFSSTSCPHRSWDLHGKSTNEVKDYFISQVSKHMGAKPPVVAPKPKPPVVKPKPPKPTPPKPSSGWIKESATFTAWSTIKLRTSAPSGSVISNIKAGQKVKYDAYKVIGNQVWVRQPRGSSYGYMCVRENGKPWGSFS